MNLHKSNAFIPRVVFISACALVLVFLVARRGLTAHAQGTHVPVHMTTDWTNRHVKFSTPTSSEQIKKLQSDPRFMEQQISRRTSAPAQVKP